MQLTFLNDSKIVAPVDFAPNAGRTTKFRYCLNNFSLILRSHYFLHYQTPPNLNIDSFVSHII